MSQDGHQPDPAEVRRAVILIIAIFAGIGIIGTLVLLAAAGPLAV